MDFAKVQRRGRHLNTMGCVELQTLLVEQKDGSDDDYNRAAGVGGRVSGTSGGGGGGLIELNSMGDGSVSGSLGYFDALEPAVTNKILSLLGVKELSVMSGVCRGFRELAGADALWARHFESSWGLPRTTVPFIRALCHHYDRVVLEEGALTFRTLQQCWLAEEKAGLGGRAFRKEKFRSRVTGAVFGTDSVEPGFYEGPHIAAGEGLIVLELDPQAYRCTVISTSQQQLVSNFPLACLPPLYTGKGVYAPVYFHRLPPLTSSTSPIHPWAHMRGLALTAACMGLLPCFSYILFLPPVLEAVGMPFAVAPIVMGLALSFVVVRMMSPRTHRGFVATVFVWLNTLMMMFTLVWAALVAEDMSMAPNYGPSSTLMTAFSPLVYSVFLSVLLWTVLFPMLNVLPWPSRMECICAGELSIFATYVLFGGVFGRSAIVWITACVANVTLALLVYGWTSNLLRDRSSHHSMSLSGGYEQLAVRPEKEEWKAENADLWRATRRYLLLACGCFAAFQVCVLSESDESVWTSEWVFAFVPLIACQVTLFLLARRWYAEGGIVAIQFEPIGGVAAAREGDIRRMTFAQAKERALCYVPLCDSTADASWA